MGKTRKWIKNFLLEKKDKEKEGEKEKEKCIVPVNPSTPITILPMTPKEKNKWSFRRSSATTGGSKDSSSVEGVAITSTPPTTNTATAAVQAMLDGENEQKKHALAVAATTAAAADAAVAATQAAAEVIRLTIAANGKASDVEEASAVTIQSVFPFLFGKESTVSIRRISKATSISKRSPGEETSDGYTPVYAGFGSV